MIDSSRAQTTSAGQCKGVVLHMRSGESIAILAADELSSYVGTPEEAAVQAFKGRELDLIGADDSLRLGRFIIRLGDVSVVEFV